MLKRFDKRLVTILSIVFVQIAGAAMILPILPLFAQREFQMHPSSITLLVSSYFIAQFFAGPWLGHLSDQYGRIPILIFSQVGSAISFFMMAAAGGPIMLFAARFVDGITGGNIIVAQAYITDVTPKEKRTEALGYIYAVFGMAFIIGPALGGFLSYALGARMPFVIAGVASLFTALMVRLLLEETVDSRESTRIARQRTRIRLADVIQNAPLMLILVIAFVGQFGHGMLQSTFALYGDDVLFTGYSNEMTNLGVGLLLGAVGLGQVITQVWLIGPLKRRFGDGRLVVLGNSLRGIGLMLFALITSPWLAGGVALIFASGMGLMMPALQSLTTRTADETMRGGVLGVYQSSVSLATIFSTAIAGTIYTISPTAPYWVGAGLSLLVLLPAIALLRMARMGTLIEAPVPKM